MTALSTPFAAFTRNGCDAIAGSAAAPSKEERPLEEDASEGSFREVLAPLVDRGESRVRERSQASAAQRQRRPESHMADGLDRRSQSVEGSAPAEEAREEHDPQTAIPKDGPSGGPAGSRPKPVRGGAPTDESEERDAPSDAAASSQVPQPVSGNPQERVVREEIDGEWGAFPPAASSDDEGNAGQTDAASTGTASALWTMAPVNTTPSPIDRNGATPDGDSASDAGQLSAPAAAVPQAVSLPLDNSAPTQSTVDGSSPSGEAVAALATPAETLGFLVEIQSDPQPGQAPASMPSDATSAEPVASDPMLETVAAQPPALPENTPDDAESLAVAFGNPTADASKGAELQNKTAWAPESGDADKAKADQPYAALIPSASAPDFSQAGTGAPTADTRAEDLSCPAGHPGPTPEAASAQLNGVSSEQSVSADGRESAAPLAFGARLVAAAEGRKQDSESTVDVTPELSESPRRAEGQSDSGQAGKPLLSADKGAAAVSAAPAQPAAAFHSAGGDAGNGNAAATKRALATASTVPQSAASAGQGQAELESTQLQAGHPESRAEGHEREQGQGERKQQDGGNLSSRSADPAITGRPLTEASAPMVSAGGATTPQTAAIAAPAQATVEASDALTPASASRVGASAPVKDPAPVAPLKEVTLELGLGAQKVAVRVEQRQGELRVAVRTPDAALNTELRRELPALTTKLEQSGFRTETWHGGEVQQRQTVETQAGNLGQDARDQGAGERRNQQREQQQQQQEQQARREEALRRPGGQARREEFSWLLAGKR